MPKKLKWDGTLWDFSTSFLSPNIKIIEGGPPRKKFEIVSMPKKTEREEPLVSPCTVCYAEKQEKSFWFSLLGEMVQFDTIVIRRTFEELFWSIRVD